MFCLAAAPGERYGVSWSASQAVKKLACSYGTNQHNISDPTPLLRSCACLQPPKRCSPECSSCSSTANAWQPSKTHKTDHLMSPQQATVPAYQDERQEQQSAPLTGLVLAHCCAPPQQSARTQQLLHLLILLRARRQLRSNNAAGQQQQQQQLVSAAPALYCPQPTPVSHHLPL
jgi:hypothetical protein